MYSLLCWGVLVNVNGEEVIEDRKARVPWNKPCAYSLFGLTFDDDIEAFELSS
jgi:hypothetical protein